MKGPWLPWSQRMTPTGLCKGRLTGPLSLALGPFSEAFGSPLLTPHCPTLCACVPKGVFGGLLGAGDSSLSPVVLLSECLCYDSWAAFIQTKSPLSAVHLLA